MTIVNMVESRELVVVEAVERWDVVTCRVSCAATSFVLVDQRASVYIP